MFDQLITLNEFNRGYLTQLMSDVPDSQIDVQPEAGLHSVRWILAHLAIVVDYGFSQINMPFVCPLAWHGAYGPGSAPGTSETVRPDREELLSTIENGYASLCLALRATDLEILNVPHEVELLRQTQLKTKADLVAHILTTHFATHLGQLSMLRRQMGLPAQL